MLAIVQIPIFDPRGLARSPADIRRAARLLKPSWDAPGEIVALRREHRPPFLRSAGAVVERRATGLRGRFSEEVFCRAKRAVRLPALTPIELIDPADPDAFTLNVWPRVSFRNFYHDGRVMGKLEIGFSIQGEHQRRAVLEGGTDAFARHLLLQLAEVRGARRPVAALAEAGPAVAEFYNQASTRQPQGVEKLLRWIKGADETPSCRAGAPLVLMVAARGALAPEVEADTVAEWGECSIHRWDARVRSAPSDIVLISEEGDRTSEQARNLRIFLCRIHAELTAIDGVLGAVRSIAREGESRRELDAARDIMRWFDRYKFDEIGDLVDRVGVQTRLLGGDGVGEEVVAAIWGARYEKLAARREDIWSDLDLRAGKSAGVKAAASYRRLKIFISYRREDAQAIGRKLTKYLEKALPTGEIFFDDKIRWGEHWPRRIEKALRDYDVVLALAGAKWAGGDDPGARRIDDEFDPVRREVELGLKRGLKVVPVLIGDAPFPADLPDSLKDFSEVNAARLRSGSAFQEDARRLLEALV